MAVGDHFKLVMKGRLYARVVQNVFYYAVTSEPTDPQGTARGLCEAFVADIVPLWSAAQSEDAAIDCVIATPVDTQLLHGYELNFGGDDTGNITGQSMPGNVAVVLNRLAPFAGGVSRSPLFFWGIPENETDSNEIDSVYQTNQIDPINNALSAAINVTGTFASSFDPVNRRGQFKALSQLSVNFVASSGGVQRLDGGNWATDGFVGGQVVSFPGATNPANNGPFTILSVTANTLLMTGGSGIQDENGVVTDVLVSPSSDVFPSITSVVNRRKLYTMRSRQTERTAYANIL